MRSFANFNDWIIRVIAVHGLLVLNSEVQSIFLLAKNGNSCWKFKLWLASWMWNKTTNNEPLRYHIHFR